MKNLKKWLLLGILLRLLIMPFTGHWDLTSLYQVADSWITSGKDSVYQHYFAIYPPLTYLFLAFWPILLSAFLLPDFHKFLWESNIISFTSPFTSRYLFLLKLPYLFFDLSIGFLLLKLLEDKKQQEKIFKLWMINPITLYATFAWGTIDIIPSFLIVLALYLSFKNHGFWAALCLGIGASFKVFPLLLLLPLVLINSYNNKERIKMFLAGLLPFLATILPFLADRNFLIRFFSSDQLQIIQHASFYVGREQHISLFYILYVIFLIVLYRQRLDKSNLIWVFFLVLFVFYALSAFTPQWFVWGLPFFLLVVVKNNLSIKWYALTLGLYFFLVFLFEITLNFGLLAPIERSLLEYPSLGEIISRFFDTNRLNGLIRSVLAGVFLYLIYITRPKKMYVNS